MAPTAPAARTAPVGKTKTKESREGNQYPLGKSAKQGNMQLGAAGSSTDLELHGERSSCRFTQATETETEREEKKKVGELQGERKEKGTTQGTTFNSTVDCCSCQQYPRIYHFGVTSETEVAVIVVCSCYMDQEAHDGKRSSAGGLGRSVCGGRCAL